MLSNKQEKAIHEVSSIYGDFLDPVLLGLRVADPIYKKPLLGIDWSLLALEEIEIEKLFMKHGSI